LDLCVNLYIFVSWLVFFILYFHNFVLGCGSLGPKEDIMRFSYGRGSYTLFAHIFFVKNFRFLYSFLGIGVVCAFFHTYLLGC